MEELQTHKHDRTRWYQRVLPMAGLVLAVVALVVQLVPAFRDQVALSTTRQPQPFVELFFTPTQPAAEARCAAGEVRFTVRSQLEETRRLAYRVTVEPTEGAARTSDGTVRVRPDETRRVTADVPTSGAQDYTVTVRLPALDQQLRAHCPGSRG